jgi:hypothetical protein
MASIDQVNGGRLLRRAPAIVLRPDQTWRDIAADDVSGHALFTQYVVVLAAISPVCATVGRLAFGERALGMTFRPTLIAALIEAVMFYGLALGSVYALALLMQKLAPPFGGAADRRAAYKLAAYSSTPGWLASVAYLYPPLGILALVGVLYGLYLLYLGAERLMQTGGRRTLGYVSLVVVCYAVLMMLVVSMTKLAAALA